MIQAPFPPISDKVILATDEVSTENYLPALRYETIISQVG